MKWNKIYEAYVCAPWIVIPKVISHTFFRVKENWIMGKTVIA